MHLGKLRDQGRVSAVLRPWKRAQAYLLRQLGEVETVAPSQFVCAAEQVTGMGEGSG